jgi:hypothetical protein
MHDKLNQIMAIPVFREKMEQALYSAMLAYQLDVDDELADEETVASEDFESDSEFRYGDLEACLTDGRLSFAVTGNLAVRYRDIRNGEDEIADQYPVRCEGVALLSNLDLIADEDVEGVAGMLHVKIPLLELKVVKI